MISHLELKAYAKINPGLDVLRRREDGYHEVRMIMQTIGLFDRIDLTAVKTPGITLKCNLYHLPVDGRNIAVQAAEKLFAKYGLTGGLLIRLQKYIPVAAGLAGGSADAAAVLRGMNKMYALSMTDKELAETGVSIGADVPYCLKGGTVMAEGIGEKLTTLPDMPACSVVLVKPPFGVSTKHVYESLHVDTLPRTAHPDLDAVLRAIREKNIRGVAENMGNILETVTAEENPVIGQIKSVMLNAGAAGVLMSGSGPAVFGLFEREQAAMDCVGAFRAGGGGMVKQVYRTGIVNAETAVPVL